MVEIHRAWRTRRLGSLRRRTNQDAGVNGLAGSKELRPNWREVFIGQRLLSDSAEERNLEISPNQIVRAQRASEVAEVVAAP
jgi:hypothetical protein